MTYKLKELCRHEIQTMGTANKFSDTKNDRGKRLKKV